MQRELTRRGLYQDKIDGKAGMLTRSVLGAYQKASGLKVDCWPAQSVLDHMQKIAKPGRAWRDRVRDQALRRRSDQGAEEARTAAIADHVAVRVIHRGTRAQ